MAAYLKTHLFTKTLAEEKPLDRPLELIITEFEPQKAVGK